MKQMALGNDETDSNSVDLQVENASVPDNAVKLFDLLVSINLTQHFGKFLEQDFDDDVIDFLDPHSPSFLNTISKVLPKVGTQLKFQNGLKKYKKTTGVELQTEGVGAGNGNPCGDEKIQETELQYNSFNKHEVSSRFFI